MEQAPIEALGRGATLIAVNRRLATYLRQAYDRLQGERSEAVWPSADILPLGAWLRRAWDLGAEAFAEREGTAPPPMLPDTLQAVLWERVVASSAVGKTLINASGAADQALQAHTLLHQWNLTPQILQAELAPAKTAEAATHSVDSETQTFLSWQAEVAQWLQERAWADPATLPHVVADWLAQGLIPPPAKILLAGFDDLTPQIQDVLAALRQVGCAVETWASAVPSGTPQSTEFPGHAESSMPPRDSGPTAGPGASRAQRVAFPDPLAEWEAAASWTRALMEAPDSSSDSLGGSFDRTAPIGIVVPDLWQIRDDLERVFRDRLMPGCDLREPSNHEPYNLSLGKPLAAAPAVRQALELLAPWSVPQNHTTFVELLRSPFLAAAESEQAGRARLEARLRSDGALGYCWGDILALVADHNRGRNPLAPQLAQILRAAEKQAQALESTEASPGTPSHTPSHAPSQWAEHFSERLEIFGWPGERALTSTEYQVVQAWLMLLDEFASLDPILLGLSWGEAVTRLSWLAGRQIFQPQRDAAPVQILGVLEAAGLKFRALWLLGMDDATWPPAPQPNPYLPVGLQRRLGMPHASAARELEFTQQETQRLLAAAPVVIASHALTQEEQELGMSPLLAHLPSTKPEALPATATPKARDVVAATPGPVPFRDGKVPVIQPGIQMSGGVRLFADQAACPFRAFALHRLRAEALESPTPGLSGSDQGLIVHRAKELLWEDLQNHQRLKALSPDQVQATTTQAANQAVVEFAEGNPRHGSALFDLERQRVASLLNDFLEYERKRVPFAVMAREEKHEATYSGITITTRVDRIDRLEDGRHIIIDYKTGEATRSSWYGARPKEPQLPLYCASATIGGQDINLAGVAFARVSRKHMGFEALAETKDLLPGAIPFEKVKDKVPFEDGTTLVESWGKTLAALALAFREDGPRLDPHPPPGSSGSPCEHCKLPLLCRLADWTQARVAPGNPHGLDDDKAQ